MKKLLRFGLLLLTVAAVSMTSCSKGDDAPNWSVEDLYGSWKLSTVSMMGATMTADDLGMYLGLTFSSAGTWTGSASSTEIDIPPFGNGTYSVSGKTLTLKELTYAYKWTVKKLTEDELVIVWKFSGIDMTWGFDRVS